MAPKMTAAAEKPAKAAKPVVAEMSTMPPTLAKPEEGAAPMTPKNFRNHPDMENFFRFIYENDLRLEALQIIDEIISTRKAKRKKSPASV